MMEKGNFGMGQLPRWCWSQHAFPFLNSLSHSLFLAYNSLLSRGLATHVSETLNFHIQCFLVLKDILTEVSRSEVA